MIIDYKRTMTGLKTDDDHYEQIMSAVCASITIVLCKEMVKLYS